MKGQDQAGATAAALPCGNPNCPDPSSTARLQFIPRGFTGPRVLGATSFHRKKADCARHFGVQDPPRAPGRKRREETLTIPVGKRLEADVPRGAIASTLQSSEEREEGVDVAPTCVRPGASLATPPAQPGCITCPCRRSRAPAGCIGIALHGVLGGLSVQMQASSRTHMSISISSRASRTRSPTAWRRTAQARSWTCMRKWHVYPAYWPM